MLNLDTMHAKELLYIILNVLVVIGAVLYLLQMYFHIRNVGRTMYFLSLRGFPAKSVFLVSCCLVIFTYRRHDPRHNPKDGTIMSNVAESFVRMFIMSLTEFAVFFEQMEQCHLSTLGKVTFMIYMLLVTMLLMNMLIAMMTNTYTEVAANSLEYLRQWSAIVLNMEQSFDPETRLKFQRCYSVPMEDGKGIGLLMKIRLTEEEQEVERLVQKQRRRRFNEEKMRQLAED
ncbi:Ion-trans domain-containing protein [Aphelenchoides besseyi]|nr:Ion-trans domain-containing protein [Aphelenchoides besseyi]